MRTQFAIDVPQRQPGLIGFVFGKLFAKKFLFEVDARIRVECDVLITVSTGRADEMRQILRESDFEAWNEREVE